MTIKIVRASESLTSNDHIVLKIPRGEAAAIPATRAAAPIAKSPEDLQAMELARQSELKKRFEEAESRGYTEGLQKAAAEQKILLGTKMKRFDDLAAGIEKLRDDFRGMLEDAVVELSLAAVLKVIGGTVWTPEQMRDYVKRAADKAGYLPFDLKVKVSPSDFELLTSEPAFSARNKHPRITWEPDTRISLGGCIVESPKGHLDLRIETRLERLKEALLEARRSGM